MREIYIERGVGSQKTVIRSTVKWYRVNDSMTESRDSDGREEPTLRPRPCKSKRPSRDNPKWFIPVISLWCPRFPLFRDEERRPTYNPLAVGRHKVGPTSSRVDIVVDLGWPSKSVSVLVGITLWSWSVVRGQGPRPRTRVLGEGVWVPVIVVGSGRDLQTRTQSLPGGEVRVITGVQRCKPYQLVRGEGLYKRVNLWCEKTKRRMDDLQKSRETWGF